jgi:hypothetical protein
VWEPDWAVKVRQKSTATVVLGMESQAASGRAERRSGGETEPESAANPTDAAIKEGAKALRGILGF